MNDPVEVVDQKVQPTQNARYSPSSIVLYGRSIGSVSAVVGTDNDKVDMLTWAFRFLPQPIIYNVALIYGFAYQGHCYSLPEPVAFVVPPANNPAVGCGYEGAGNFNYQMWTVEKLDKTVQVQMTNDTFEELLLRRTIAGARPPLSYRAAARLAHRGGQLTE
jgi:hypothetical protein